jgi:hypothetical protein
MSGFDFLVRTAESVSYLKKLIALQGSEQTLAVKGVKQHNITNTSNPDSKFL